MIRMAIMMVMVMVMDELFDVTFSGGETFSMCFWSSSKGSCSICWKCKTNSLQNYWEKFPNQLLTLWCCRNSVEVYLFKATLQWDICSSKPPSSPFPWICLPLDWIRTFFRWIWTPPDRTWTSRNWIQLKSIVAQKYILIQYLFKSTVQWCNVCVVGFGFKGWNGFGNGWNCSLQRNTFQSRLSSRFRSFILVGRKHAKSNNIWVLLAWILTLLGQVFDLLGSIGYNSTWDDCRGGGEWYEGKANRIAAVPPSTHPTQLQISDQLSYFIFIFGTPQHIWWYLLYTLSWHIYLRQVWLLFEYKWFRGFHSTL